jgi:hypothetical protein
MKSVMYFVSVPYHVRLKKAGMCVMICQIKRGCRRHKENANGGGRRMGIEGKENVVPKAKGAVREEIAQLCLMH